jgi:hypothetical protein
VTRTDTVKQDGDMGTVRIDYTFGGPVVARYAIQKAVSPGVRIRGLCLRDV